MRTCAALGTLPIPGPPRRRLADRLHQRHQFLTQSLEQDGQLGRSGTRLIVVQERVVERGARDTGIGDLAQAGRFLSFELDNLLQPRAETLKTGLTPRRDPLLLGQRGGSGQRFHQVARQPGLSFIVPAQLTDVDGRRRFGIGHQVGAPDDGQQLTEPGIGRALVVQPGQVAICSPRCAEPPLGM